MDTDVIIIGGGIAGLACALELGKAGLGVTLLERSDILGGRACSWTDPATGDRVDIGPHILLTEYRNMLRLLDKLGTGDRIVWQSGKFITLVDQPHPVAIYMRHLPAPLHFLPSLLKAPQVSQLDLLSNYRLLWQVMRLRPADALELDTISAEEHLRRMGVSGRMIDWFWRSAAMSIMNVPLEHCSAGALLSFFRYMMGISGYQVGFAGEGLGDLFAPESVRRIEAAGGRVLLQAEVVRLIGKNETLTGVELADGSRIAAPLCVAAIPPQALRPLLPEPWVQQHDVFKRLADFKPSPYISSYIWFDRKLTHERFWTRVWSPTNLNYDSYDLSNIRPGWAERPSVIASNIVYSYRAAELSDEEVIEATVQEIAAFAPVAAQAQVRHARVHRIPMAIPAPYPGSERLRPTPRTAIDGLFLAGDWLQTGLPASMESAVRAGWLAAEQILAATGRPRQLALPPPSVKGLVRLLGGHG
jgi:15-cis-phytoene desaturase